MHIFWIFILLITIGCASPQIEERSALIENKVEEPEWTEEKSIDLADHEIDAKIFRLEAQISQVDIEIYPKRTMLKRYPEKQQWRREFLQMQTEVNSLEIRKATLEEALAHLRSCRYTGVCEL